MWAQHDDGSGGYGRSSRGGRPEHGSNDVLRRAPPANEYAGYRGKDGGGGSILRRLTVGNSGRYRITGPPPDHNEGDEGGVSSGLPPTTNG